MLTLNTDAAAFTGLVDLAQEKLGGRALICSDEFFAEKENLLKAGRGIWDPDRYTPNGKWMDGWESRRKRVPGYDWCILQLGLSGVIRGVDIDTNHFLGNNPAYGSVDACRADRDLSSDPAAAEKLEWVEILPKVPLKPGSQNLFGVASEERWTHIRLNIYPDGGVARFRVYGNVIPDWKKLDNGKPFDLVAVQNGGSIVACNDMFFGAPENMLMPGRGIHMGDAWETRRKRQPGYDWTIVKLGAPGLIKSVDVDTAWHIGNYPDTCSLDVCYSPDKEVDGLNWQTVEWTEILPKTKLKADSPHLFEKELKVDGPATHIRLNIHPDGGVSRLRVYGMLAK